ncbi:unnamed protein product [Ixodes pacificus]
MPWGKHSQQCFGVRLSTSYVIYSKLPDSKTLLLEHTCAFSPNGIQSKLQSLALHIPLLWLSLFPTAFTVAARATKKATLRVVALSSAILVQTPMAIFTTWKCNFLGFGFGVGKLGRLRTCPSADWFNTSRGWKSFLRFRVTAKDFKNQDGLSCCYSVV